METSHHFSAIELALDNGVIFVHRTKDKLLAFAQTNFFVMYVSGQFRLKCQLEKNIVHDTPQCSERNQNVQKVLYQRN